MVPPSYTESGTWKGGERSRKERNAIRKAKYILKKFSKREKKSEREKKGRERRCAELKKLRDRSRYDERDYRSRRSRSRERREWSRQRRERSRERRERSREKRERSRERRDRSRERRERSRDREERRRPREERRCSRDEKENRDNKNNNRNKEGGLLVLDPPEDFVTTLTGAPETEMSEDLSEEQAELLKAHGPLADIELEKLPRPLSSLNCHQARSYLVKLLRAANGGQNPQYGNPNSKPPFWPDYYWPWSKLTDIHTKPRGMEEPLLYSEMMKLAIQRGYKYYGYDPENYWDKTVEASETAPVERDKDEENRNIRNNRKQSCTRVFSRVIGRGGSNITAIRELSGAGNKTRIEAKKIHEKSVSLEETNRELQERLDYNLESSMKTEEVTKVKKLTDEAAEDDNEPLEIMMDMNEMKDLLPIPTTGPPPFKFKMTGKTQAGEMKNDDAVKPEIIKNIFRFESTDIRERPDYVSKIKKRS